MVWVPGGSFLMGSNDFYPEERPTRSAAVTAFWMDEHPVTNAEFRRFARATSYVTLAERTPDPALYPEADPGSLVKGSLVFQKPRHPVSLDDYRRWWAYVPGASWQHPEGPGSTLDGRDRHPVVHVAYEDALAYASWAGKELPTEAEWEFAARGGLEGAVYVWGSDFAPKGKQMANTWQGEFPWQNLKTDGYEGTSPVGAFPPNGYGLFDMAGNVWEWTSDHYRPSHAPQHDRRPVPQSDAPCCVGSYSGVPGEPSAVPQHPMGPREPSSAIASRVARRVVKGGSHLCAPSYCLRYRPAARQGEAVDTSTSHVGFRCIVRPH